MDVAGDEPGWIDLGHDTSYRRVSDRGGRWVGIIERHPCGDDMMYGTVPFNTWAAREAYPTGPNWQLLSRDPLTLQPSLACDRCAHHGWIRDGQWQPA